MAKYKVIEDYLAEGQNIVPELSERPTYTLSYQFLKDDVVEAADLLDEQISVLTDYGFLDGKVKYIGECIFYIPIKNVLLIDDDVPSGETSSDDSPPSSNTTTTSTTTTAQPVKNTDDVPKEQTPVNTTAPEKSNEKYIILGVFLIIILWLIAVKGCGN